MKTFKEVLTIFFIFSIAISQAQNLKKQKEFLPNQIRKMEVYLGSDKKVLLKNCPDCEDQFMKESFRTIYKVDLENSQFQSIIFYVSTEKDEVYEIILVAKENQDISKIAHQLYGIPTTENGEWRLLPEKTLQNFNIAVWTYKNKLIIAGDLVGSEWEDGFD